MKTQKVRYEYLDVIRGIAVCSMVVYHAVWNLVYIFGKSLAWYEGTVGHLWQQSICWTFICLSGFCFSMSHHKIKRSMTTFCAGLLVSIVTILVVPEQRILFGVLTLIGSSGLLLTCLEGILTKIPPLLGVFLSGGAFLWLRSISLPVSPCPGSYFFTFLGFPFVGFYSTDYFPLIPWTFLYVTGYFMYKYIKSEHEMWLLIPNRWNWRSVPFYWIGKHTLLIYLLHQPLLYGGMLLLRGGNL